MGTYSHVCNISKITISAGHKCVFVPLLDCKTPSTESLSIGLLPIFGTYSGYGYLEQIEHDENTAHISKWFSCSIESFVKGIMRQEYDGIVYEEYQNWMLIDRNVWDNLTSKIYGPAKLLDHSFGSKSFLKKLGFKLVTKTNSGRYNQVWEYNGVQVLSDGSTLKSISNENVYYRYSDLIEKFGVPKELAWIDNTHQGLMWKWYLSDTLMLDRMFSSMLFNVMDVFKRLKSKSMDITDYVNSLRDEDYPLAQQELRFYDGPLLHYFMKIHTFGDTFAALAVLQHNCYSFSTIFNNQDNASTPQYGNYQAHAEVLEMFTTVCKEYAADEYRRYND